MTLAGNETRSVYLDEKQKVKPERCAICGERKGMTCGKQGSIGGELYSEGGMYLGWTCWRRDCIAAAWDREDWSILN